MEQTISLEGRPIRITGVRRITARKGWGYYNEVAFAYLDEQEPRFGWMGAAKFHKLTGVAAPKPARYSEER